VQACFCQPRCFSRWRYRRRQSLRTFRRIFPRRRRRRHLYARERPETVGCHGALPRTAHPILDPPGNKVSTPRSIIRDRLVTAGFSLATANASASVRVDEFANSGRGWDRIGTLEFDDGSKPLLSRDRDHVAGDQLFLAGRRPGSLSSTLAPGRPAIMRERTSRAVVLGDAPLSRLWQDAVKRRRRRRLDRDRLHPAIRSFRDVDRTKDVLQWGSVPYGTTAGVGFKSSWRAADRMQARLKRARSMCVTIDSSF
jgi:hypothetical protein